MAVSKEEDTLGQRAHKHAENMNRDREAHQKALAARDKQKREALLKLSAPILMAGCLYSHFSLLILECSEQGGFSLTGYILPVTETTKVAVALVEARLATEDVKLTWTEAPYESTLGATNHDFLHLTLNW